jgi:MSHA pilin protein MshA
MKNSINVKANQEGFTLIELVVVIVILGILAVTAAPKFINLTADAKGAVVEAVEGSLKSAADLAHAKSLINGDSSASISIAGETINFIHSYPTALTIGLLMDIDTAASIGDFVLVSSSAGTTITHASAVTPANCQAKYLEPTGVGLSPAISSDISDC